jgi:hypothetical protein
MDLTPLEERLCMVVKLRQAAIESAALQTLAYGSMNEHNHKAVTAALDRYMSLRFPGRRGPSSDEQKRMRQARELLAREVEKVYLIEPYKGDGKDLISSAMESSHPEFAAAARQAVAIDARQVIQREKARRG